MGDIKAFFQISKTTKEGAVASRALPFVCRLFSNSCYILLNKHLSLRYTKSSAWPQLEHFTPTPQAIRPPASSLPRQLKTVATSFGLCTELKAYSKMLFYHTPSGLTQMSSSTFFKTCNVSSFFFLSLYWTQEILWICLASRSWIPRWSFHDKQASILRHWQSWFAVQVWHHTWYLGQCWSQFLLCL